MGALRFEVGTGTDKFFQRRIFVRIFSLQGWSDEPPEVLKRLAKMLRGGESILILQKEFPEYAKVFPMLHAVLSQGSVDRESFSAIRLDMDFGHVFSFKLQPH